MSSSQNLTFDGRPTVWNFTLWYNPSLCTLDTCPKSYAVLQYVPSLGGNALFLAWFIIIFVAQSVIGIYKRTWTFFAAMIGGCILEVIGYAARVLMHENIFDFNWFLMCGFISLLLVLEKGFFFSHSPISSGSCYS